MQSLLDQSFRDEIVARINRLSPDAQRRWGTMSVGQMLCHVSDQLRFAVGDLQPNPEATGPLTWRPVQWFGIVVAPWPKGKIQTSPQLLQTSPADLERDRAALQSLIERFVDRAHEGPLGPHPMFGYLPTGLWTRLAGRHLDYHLRQFGL